MHYKINNMRNEVLTVRSDKQTKKKLAQLAKNSNRTMSDYLRLLINYAEQNQIKL